MVKPFGIWKYFLILIVLSFGIIYALPNLYAPDPAVQISYNDSTLSPDIKLQKRLTKVLEANTSENKVPEVEIHENYALIRLASSKEQLRVKELFSTVGDDLIVALNLAPTTPQWLKNIGGEPLKLGLDLRGGVHFLMEVDTQKALNNRQNGTLLDIRRKLRGEKIRYNSLFVEKDQAIKLKVTQESVFDNATELLEDNYPQFTISYTEAGNQFEISLRLTEQEIEQIEADAIDQNLTTLRNRVNELGVSEPIVYRQGKKRIVVQLPGIQDTAEAKKILGKTATLEFHLEAEHDTPRTRKTSYPHRDKRMGVSELQDQIIIGGDQVATAQASFDENGIPQVNITLDGAGGARMHRTTRDKIGKRLGVLFVEQKNKTSYARDAQGNQVAIQQTFETKEIISLATIQAALGTKFRITGLDSPQESSELALLLRAGALAAPMRFVEERTVGPSLGKDNINAGILSMELGMALVLLFTLFYYRIFGVAACLALGTNIVLLVAIMSILSATLTLPGIAGIVLTVGMAVDANVLIFSRIKEELKQGTEPLQAIDQGYDKAFLTILDANLTTLLVAVILYSFGTGPIKGFSVTLSIGIITSMFTAILGTRGFIYLVYRNKKNLSRLAI
ncbi:MAG TPA: protein translocase subunit SecD [Gammaproteobacteria bacterium]|nr:protein translocase subunit SecD [Gammaproteobacteria bacterium]HIO04235.1 protein translocase subunit SecD [Gammaproteobacteria bacterium]